MSKTRRASLLPLHRKPPPYALHRLIALFLPTGAVSHTIAVHVAILLPVHPIVSQRPVRGDTKKLCMCQAQPEPVNTIKIGLVMMTTLPQACWLRLGSSWVHSKRLGSSCVCIVSWWCICRGPVNGVPVQQRWRKDARALEREEEVCSPPLLFKLATTALKRLAAPAIHMYTCSRICSSS